VTSSEDSKDLSNGWEVKSKEFMSIATRNTGANTVKNWSKCFPIRYSILDIGCGFGGSYTKNLIENGAEVYGIDSSNTLIEEHKKKFTEAIVRCEAAEDSTFFNKEFDAVIAIGLIFLLSRENQILVLQKMAKALKEGGRLLFTSPYQICEWDDLLTGLKSQSLGKEAYMDILQEHGLSLVNEYTDEGENHYYDFQKNALL